MADWRSKAGSKVGALDPAFSCGKTKVGNDDNHRKEVKHMKTAVILRGCPGSGKSTVVKRSYPTATVCSADNFHMRVVTAADGTVSLVYDWKAVNQGWAHQQCKIAFQNALDRGVELVVVDNTNIKPQEYRQYVEAAKLCGYRVVVHEVLATTSAQVEKCVLRNVHRVPAETVRRMAASLQPNTVDGVDEVIVETMKE